MARSSSDLYAMTPQPSSREQRLRQAYQRVQRLTRLGLHAEAHALWEAEISAVLHHEPLGTAV